MADIPIFYMVAFSRTDWDELRAEVATKAYSEQHAASLASQFAGEGRGAVAFSQMGASAVAPGGDVEILARFGDVPDDRELHHWFSGVRASERRDTTSALANATARSAQVTRWPRSVLSRMMPFAPKREQSPRQGRSYSLAMAWLVAVAIAASGSGILGITAWAAQREARLVEMAQPTCDHTGTTDKELHRLVRYGYRVGVSKKRAFRTVITLCLAKSAQVEADVRSAHLIELPD
ncbi:hypothetical protein SAMN05519104_8013 [Rhizobiales bacterium GAS188]|nr:hypothetical protein SAMN05519104_8013 [Rhizobiales bacterium GAS188]